VLDDCFDYCFPILDKIGHKLDSIEDDIDEGRSEEIVRDISKAKQEIISYRKIIKPERATLRGLAAWPQTEVPTISAYLDLRPQATGENPQVRSGLIVLRDRLRQLEREYSPHSAEHDSLGQDVERLDDYLESEALPDVQCLAVFACHGSDRRFAAIETAHPLDNQVSAGAHPRLMPLARLADQDEAVVALADTNTLRLFARRSGALEEIGLLDDEPDDYSRADVGGWSQARFQRHVEEHREAFAELAVQALDEVARQEQAHRLVICADEVAAKLLVDALPKPLAENVRGILRADTRATAEELGREVLPFLEQLDNDEANEAADRLVGELSREGLAVAGVEGTEAALTVGQVAELLVDPAIELDEAVIEGLLRAAAATDARIRFPPDHGGLRQLGGLGGLLRFGLDRDVSGPQSGDQRQGAAVSG
jgi:hypothetical protein